ncbi:protein-methionine-sulfoxide reductase heme-binding subunit MsrQ [Alcanivorax sediminis]|uniref:Protein-methionine-sulfoxide reductase heme-binding subunit MsrQ n=1 Tax=Alcanivorax sediminis TaxID=2663008 RepID=A0A6N7LWM5_9GAMM|nr:protein-methionine-sulfoxide reductase heme-binding subunit MsrQ [Alcanivorax sediminis]MQX54857.1 sulfoxide reductase heme-binding subunit YedZ [Alcanivorax sediminis]
MKTNQWSWLAWPLGALPLAGIIYQAVSGQMGPDPAETLVKLLGWWSLVMLLVCLAMRPAAQLMRVPGLVIWRRTFGLWAFAYVCMHFICWGTLLLGWDPAYLGQELTKRPYIIVGSLGWLALWPLALTSTRRSRRRLGQKWVKLHRLVFVALALGLVHQSWVQKSGYGETLIFVSIATILLLYRVLHGRNMVKN